MTSVWERCIGTFTIHLINRVIFTLLRRTSEIYIFYTDHHDVDENLRTIGMQGGYYSDDSLSGIAYREVKYQLSTTFDVVAFMCEHHLLYLVGYHNVGHKIPTDQSIRMYLYLYKFI